MSYAVIENGTVVNAIVWDGTPYAPAIPEVRDADGNIIQEAIPAQGWAPPEGCIAVFLPEGSPVSIGWNYDYDTGAFTPPPIVPPPPPSEAEMMILRNSLLDYATQQINPLQDLVDIGESTAEDEALLLLWKKYRAAVGKVTSQPGWHLSVVWPVQPV